MNRTRLTLALVLLLTLSGCVAGVQPPTAGDPNWHWPDDPPHDRLGWEAGYWYNESIAVDQSDGLNASERTALVGRTMARVEKIRGLEFEQSVPVEVVSREQYRQRSTFGSNRGEAYDAWNNQVWEALLVVGEDRNATRVMSDLYGGSVLGFYSPSQDRIVVVSDSSTPKIDRATLAHELVHALQDQHFGLGGGGRTRDASLAGQGLTEGDARYVEQLYEERCADDWSCVPKPAAPTGDRNLSSLGMYLTIYTPYSEGPNLVYALRQRGGWAAVDDAYDHPPESTEQIIHPEAYPDETPVKVNVPDASSRRWSRLDVDQQTETVGEASLFTMLWTNRYVDRSALRANPGAYSAYNYSNPASAGWAGDTLVPYRNDAGEGGYVFRTAWDSDADAAAFERAYETVLVEKLGAERVDHDTYRVPNGPFADAFRVTRSGKTVTVVNAPTASQLDGVHDES